MNGRRGRTVLHTIALAALVAGGGSVFLAPAVSAAAPTIVLDPPLQGAQLTTEAMTVAGTARMASGTVTDVDVTVVYLDDAACPGGPAPTEACPGGRADLHVQPARSVSFRPGYTLFRNGRYQVKVVARGDDASPPPDLTPGESSERVENFLIDAPPATPQGLRLALNEAKRTVTLTWSANTERDLVGYQVERLGPDGTATAFQTLEPSYVDDDLGNGGEFQYHVYAVRQSGIDPKGGNKSAKPASTSTKVPAKPSPPPPSTGTSAGGGSGSGSTQVTEARSSGGGGGTVDLSGFAALRAGAKRPSPQPADPGFDEALPFQGEGEEVEEGEESGLEPGDDPQLELGVEGVAEDGGDNQRRSLAFLAGGLLTTVLLMHALWLRDEVKRADELEAVAPAAVPEGGDGAEVPAAG